MNERHEEEIDRVLCALGAVEVDAALEDRVLARLAQPVELTTRRGWWGWAVFAAFACALIMFFSMPGRHPHAVPGRITAGISPRPIQARHATNYAPALPDRSSTYVSAVRSASPPHTEERPDRGLADLPSVLAPPESLTRQESQLARIAHGPDRYDLAMLNPVERERLDEQSAAEFKQFFPPPTPQEIYLATHTNN